MVFEILLSIVVIVIDYGMALWYIRERWSHGLFRVSIAQWVLLEYLSSLPTAIIPTRCIHFDKDLVFINRWYWNDIANMLPIKDQNNVINSDSLEFDWYTKLKWSFCHNRLHFEWNSVSIPSILDEFKISHFNSRLQLNLDGYLTVLFQIPLLFEWRNGFSVFHRGNCHFPIVSIQL